eukprot:CAMPEP_0197578182 /NCGR_PEP_ID=MMETSP1326-20131121/2512_1 /TAXON_ID=1155430 /ORGANISM="Genus nov. species nov., Strain RCC2288" /LENGTH=220 /DNA_ID=CAMNT_0043141345 /DNA_START=18 /DNA_END=676 /DNA_ORIENTATION=-
MDSVGSITDIVTQGGPGAAPRHGSIDMRRGADGDAIVAAGGAAGAGLSRERRNSMNMKDALRMERQGGVTGAAPGGMDPGGVDAAAASGIFDSIGSAGSGGSGGGGAAHDSRRSSIDMKSQLRGERHFSSNGFDGDVAAAAAAVAASPRTGSASPGRGMSRERRNSMNMKDALRMERQGGMVSGSPAAGGIMDVADMADAAEVAVHMHRSGSMVLTRRNS